MSVEHLTPNTMEIIRNKKIYLSIAGILVVASLASIFVFGFKQGIDFVGGTLWQIKLDTSKEQLQEFFPNAIITSQPSTDSFLLRMPELSEEEHQTLLQQLKDEFGQVGELRFESIGPAIGQELRERSILAFLFVLLAISLYIAFVFRKVSYPVSSWKYGVITLITLFHDAIIPLGAFALLGQLINVEVDTTFVVAILVVLGFSVHDTIVVFDRIRENLKMQKKDSDFDQLVNQGVNQTIARSINTSLTLIIVLLAMFFLAAPSLKFFVLAILLGTIVGTYSSIFVASPLLTVATKRKQ